MHEGKTISVKGKEWVVPALSFKQYKEANSKFAEISKEMLESKDLEFSPKMMDDLVGLVHMAMKRNYPELTLDEVEEMMDLGNATAFTSAILGQGNSLAV